MLILVIGEEDIGLLGDVALVIFLTAAERHSSLADKRAGGSTPSLINTGSCSLL